MKIQFDPQIFSQKHGGISRKFTELIHFSKTQTPHKIDFPLFYSENEYLKEYKLSPQILPFLFDNLNAKNLLPNYKSRFYTYNKRLNNLYLSHIFMHLSQDFFSLEYVCLSIDCFFIKFKGENP